MAQPPPLEGVLQEWDGHPSSLPDYENFSHSRLTESLRGLDFFNPKQSITSPRSKKRSVSNLEKENDEIRKTLEYFSSALDNNLCQIEAIRQENIRLRKHNSELERLKEHARVSWLLTTGKAVGEGISIVQAGSACHAAKGGDIEILKEMLSFGADIHQPNCDKRTALHCAATAGEFACAGFLVSMGAPVDVKDDYGNTPLDDALRRGHVTLALFLERSQSQRDDSVLTEIFHQNVYIPAKSKGVAPFSGLRSSFSNLFGPDPPQKHYVSDPGEGAQRRLKLPNREKERVIVVTDRAQVQKQSHTEQAKESPKESKELKEPTQPKEAKELKEKDSKEPKEKESKETREAKEAKEAEIRKLNNLEPPKEFIDIRFPPSERESTHKSPPRARNRSTEVLENRESDKKENVREGSSSPLLSRRDTRQSKDLPRDGDTPRDSKKSAFREKEASDGTYSKAYEYSPNIGRKEQPHKETLTKSPRSLKKPPPMDSSLPSTPALTPHSSSANLSIPPPNPIPFIPQIEPPPKISSPAITNARRVHKVPSGQNMNPAKKVLLSSNRLPSYRDPTSGTQKNFNPFLGVIRGPCAAQSCVCPAYRPQINASTKKSTSVCVCSHYPASHKNLGRFNDSDSLGTEEEDSEYAPLSLVRDNQPEEWPKKFNTKEISHKPKRYLVAVQNDFQGASPEWLIQPHELLFLGELGTGASATVYHGFFDNVGTFHSQQVAIKMMDISVSSDHDKTERQIRDLRMEFEIMTKMDHPNVLKLLGIVVKPRISMILEYCPRGSMFDLISDPKFVLEWKLVFPWFLQSLQGISYLHNLKPPIVHRDIKTKNLLIANDMNVKVADFGASRFLDDNQTLNKMRGTYCYTAPEIYFGESYTCQADVYSMGIVLWELTHKTLTLRGAIPYSEYTWIKFDFQIIIQVAKRDIRPSIPPHCPFTLEKLIKMLWNREPEGRPDLPKLITLWGELEKDHYKHSKRWYQYAKKSGETK